MVRLRVVGVWYKVVLGSFRSLCERIKDARGVIGMVKYAVKKSGSRLVVGRESWKSLLFSSEQAYVWCSCVGMS